MYSDATREIDTLSVYGKVPLNYSILRSGLIKQETLFFIILRTTNCRPMQAIKAHRLCTEDAKYVNLNFDWVLNETTFLHSSQNLNKFDLQYVHCTFVSISSCVYSISALIQRRSFQGLFFAARENVIRHPFQGN